MIPGAFRFPEVTGLLAGHGVLAYSKEVMRQGNVDHHLAKVTSKGQTTIPVSVRTKLNVRAGDVITWDVQGDGSAVVRRVEPLDVSFLRATLDTLGEWQSAEDDEAYRDL